MGSPIISLQKAMAASKGNPDLLDVLLQVQTGQQQQAAVTGTTPVAGSVAGQPNPKASVPAQATGAVSLLGTAYVVQLVNPGATSPLSQIQSRQQAAAATSLTPLQPVTPIYHQIRASTSPSFNVNSNTQTFGGNTGSTQVYWTLTGLGKGTWYFQFRSSFDGVNFNQWRNANGGTALGGLINEVTVETVGESTWVLFTMPGEFVMGIGTAVLPDQGIFSLASELYSSGLSALAGPDGFAAQPDAIYGPNKCDLALQVPTLPVAGTPDYPVEVLMQNQVYGTAKMVSGVASIFGISVDPTNPNVAIHIDPAKTATWMVMRLPGGAKIAIGQGQNADGETIWTPGLAFMDFSRMMSICSLTDAAVTIHEGEGYGQNQITAGVVEAKMQDSFGGLNACRANWLAIAWENGAPVEMVGGFPWLKISLQGSHAVKIGAGKSPSSSSPLTLPAGYSSSQLLSIATPASSDHPGFHLRGVLECALPGLLPYLVYTDNNHYWSGDVNWMVAAWV